MYDPNCSPNARGGAPSTLKEDIFNIQITPRLPCHYDIKLLSLVLAISIFITRRRVLKASDGPSSLQYVNQYFKQDSYSVLKLPSHAKHTSQTLRLWPITRGCCITYMYNVHMLAFTDFVIINIGLLSEVRWRKSYLYSLSRIKQ